MLRTRHRLRQHEALTQKTRRPHATVYALFAYLSCNTQHKAAKTGPASLNPQEHNSHGDPITIRQVSAAVSRHLATKTSRRRSCAPTPSMLCR